MINRLIELLKDGGKQSGDVYDGFYEADVYKLGISFTIKFDFQTEHQPYEVELSDEMGRDKTADAIDSIILTSIEECWINDEDSTMLYPNKNEEKQIIELIEVTV